jgi:hypothetical protein
VEYLGHIVSMIGVQVDPKKIKATRDWTCLENAKGLSGLLRLLGYLKNFVKNYSLNNYPTQGECLFME